MPVGRIVGLMLVAIGAVLLIVGFNATEAPLERLSETLTGRYTNQTLWYLIGGAAAAAGGVAMTVFGTRNV